VIRTLERLGADVDIIVGRSGMDAERTLGAD
jgi:hypothetical protein